MYNVGQKIVYPMLGAGIIESIETKEVLGELNKYYTVKISFDDVKVMVPVDSVDTVGVRELMDSSEIDKIVQFIKNYSPEEDSSWNKRYKTNMDKLKSGNIYDIAEVAKSLSVRDKKHGLSTGERKILSNAKQIILSEIMLVKGITREEAEEVIVE